MLFVFNPNFHGFISGPIAHNCGVRAIDSSSVHSTFDWDNLAKKKNPSTRLNRTH